MRVSTATLERPGPAAPSSHSAPERARGCAQRTTDLHVINADLFKDVLFRERKRVERSNQPFVLLTLATDDDARDGSPMWGAAVQALSAAKRETDILGWIEPQTALGVILPDVRTCEGALARDLDARVRRELSRRLDPESAGRFAIRFHVHPEPKPADAQDAYRVDPLPSTLGSREEPSAIRDTAKRVLDIVGSLALLAVLSPLFLLIAALVKLKSRGPVFFRQVRIGEKAQPFTMLKFRTMYVNADHAIHQQFVTDFIKSDGQVQEPGKSGLFKITNDPRITPIGHILRKTSLDELPQFWNVLRGDMSLVGPRPPLAYEVEQYELWHHRRVLDAKPGITGLWQVAGRSRTTFDEMVRLDIRYARKRSLWTDIKILLATPKAVIAGKGAC